MLHVAAAAVGVVAVAAPVDAVVAAAAVKPRAAAAVADALPQPPCCRPTADGIGIDLAAVVAVV